MASTRQWDWKSLERWVHEQAPVCLAAGNITEIKHGFELAREADLEGLDHALSMAFPLPAGSLSGIIDRPTLLYKHAYSQVNFLMDRVALGAALRLQQAGHRAIPVPASQIIDWERLRAHVDHRMVAVHLGQGWYGRNNLLVTPSHGARVRLVTVLTDAEVNEPGPWAHKGGESGCGGCSDCVSVCPVEAIRHGPEDFDLESCAAKNKEFEKMRGIGQRICGLCVKACAGPRGRDL